MDLPSDVRFSIVLLCLAVGVSLLVTGLIDSAATLGEYIELKKAGMIPGSVLKNEAATSALYYGSLILIAGWIVYGKEPKKQE